MMKQTKHSSLYIHDVMYMDILHITKFQQCQGNILEKLLVVFGTMLCCFLLENTIISICIYFYVYACSCSCRKQDIVLNKLFLFVAVGHKGFQLDGSVVRKNVDFTRCFSCSPRMLHPLGDKYIAGHCNIPYIYDSPY